MNQLTVASRLAFVSKAQHEEKGRPPSVCERERVPSVRERERSAGKKKRKKGKRQTKVTRAPHAGPPPTHVPHRSNQRKKEKI